MMPKAQRLAYKARLITFFNHKRMDYSPVHTVQTVSAGYYRIVLESFMRNVLQKRPELVGYYRVHPNNSRVSTGC